MTKVLGVGSALVDLLIKLEDDQLLKELNLPKGSMILVDEKIKDLIAEKSAHLERVMVSGGSAANTIYGMANLGVETAFFGKVGEDKNGAFFSDDLEKSNVTPMLNHSDTPSGIASTFISKDGERTFGTYLGASVELVGSDFEPEYFHGFDLLHVEGYIVQNHELLETVLRMAKEAGLKISIDMASFNVVAENFEFLKNMVDKYVDIVFANEEEAKSFTGKEPEEALHELAKKTEVAVVKVGSKGSMVKTDGKVYIIEPKLTNAVDTTGAGDLYAAGFLYGLIEGLGFENAGYIGSMLASAVIETVGAKISENRWQTIRNEISMMRSV